MHTLLWGFCEESKHLLPQWIAVASLSTPISICLWVRPNEDIILQLDKEKLQLNHLPTAIYSRFHHHAALKMKMKEFTFNEDHLKCLHCSCRLCRICRAGGNMLHCNADFLKSASAATRSFPMVFTVFLLLFMEHNVNEAINFNTY